MVYAYGRGEALDVVHVGLVHLAEEHPRVARKALDIAPLPFGIYGVKGQRALAAAGQAREHHELVARFLKVYVLEVVLPRALYENAFSHSCKYTSYAIRLEQLIIPRRQGYCNHILCMKLPFPGELHDSIPRARTAFEPSAAWCGGSRLTRPGTAKTPRRMAAAQKPKNARIAGRFLWRERNKIKKMRGDWSCHALHISQSSCIIPPASGFVKW